jgi:hypothetical protein
MSPTVRNQVKLAGAALAAGVTMPRLVVFGCALALIACSQHGGREEAVSAAQPRDEAVHAAPASAPQISGEAVPRATQPRDEAVHAPQPGATQPRDEAVPRAAQPRDEAVQTAPPSAPQ